MTTPDSLFRLKAHSYQPRSAEAGVTGSGGVDELQFAIAEGATGDRERVEWLRMVSLTSWQEGMAGATSWAIRLIVPAA